MKKLLFLLGFLFLVSCGGSADIEPESIKKGEELCNNNNGVSFFRVGAKIFNYNNVDVYCNNGAYFYYINKEK